MSVLYRTLVPPRPTAEDAPRKPFSTVSMPTALLERAQRLVTGFPELGYTNKSSFTEEALRRWLEREEERAAAMRELYANSGKPSLDFTRTRKRQV